MGVVTASLIALTALKLNLSCEEVFIDTARKSAVIAPQESKLLKRMAVASCQTLNPDIIWSIAHTESRFRFLITRENRGKGKFKIRQGPPVLDFLDTIDGSKMPLNIDVGVMQINWRYHAAAFSHDSFGILDPKLQVEYLSRELVYELVESCGSEWVVCYHNRKHEKHKRRYARAITRSERELERHLDTLLREGESGGLADGGRRP